jgi:hypothetical protein
VVCSLIPSAFAANDEATDAANALHEIGLFNGTGTDEDGNPIYDLDRTPTRQEAVVMLVRLLGKEKEAARAGRAPFSDVADWAVPYVGYAYYHGLTTGTGEGIFGATEPISAAQYLTFVLRALGYESGTDFQWDKAWELTDALGITDGQYDADSAFTRGDVAIISKYALGTNTKDNDSTLMDDLVLSGIVSQHEANWFFDPPTEEELAQYAETAVFVQKLTDYIMTNGTVSGPVEAGSPKTISTTASKGAGGASIETYGNRGAFQFRWRYIDKDISKNGEFLWTYSADTQNAEFLIWNMPNNYDYGYVAAGTEFDIHSFTTSTALDFSLERSYEPFEDVELVNFINSLLPIAVADWDRLCSEAGVSLHDIGFYQYPQREDVSNGKR